jgi:effector-binding domain-containing protein
MVWVKRIGWTLLGLLLVLVAIGLVLPDQVFAVLNGFKRFNEWSPWAALDPKTVYRYEGPATGVGAKMSWTSDDPSVGAGSQQIVAAVPYSNIKTKLQFGPSSADANYDIQDAPGGVQLTWSMQSNFGWDLAGRYFGLFFDRTVGRDFERGLSQLKALVEQLPAESYSELKIEQMTLEPMTIAYISGSASNEPKAIEAAFAQAMTELNAFVASAGLNQTGQPLAISKAIGAERYEFDVGIPVDRADVATSGQVQFGQTWAGPALRVAHTGPYDAVASVYPKINAYLAVHQLAPGGRTWEQYMSDPASTPPNQILTYVFVPLKP